MVVALKVVVCPLDKVSVPPILLRKSPPKASEIFEYFHKELLENPNTKDEAQNIIDNVNLQIEENKKTITTRILRVVNTSE